MSINNKNKARVDLRNRLEIAKGSEIKDRAQKERTIIGRSGDATQVQQTGNFNSPKNRTPEMETATRRVRAYLANPKATDEFMTGLNNPQFDTA
jgi:hypothetical protein